MTIQFFDEEFKTSSLCPICENCVAVAYKNDHIAVRSTMDPDKKTVMFTKDEWKVFIEGVKNGDFDF